MEFMVQTNNGIRSKSVPRERCGNRCVRLDVRGMVGISFFLIRGTLPQWHTCVVLWCRWLTVFFIYLDVKYLHQMQRLNPSRNKSRPKFPDALCANTRDDFTSRLRNLLESGGVEIY